MTDQPPFRTSISARLLSVATFIALTGGGLIALLDVRSSYVLPMVLVVTILLGLIALVLGLHDHAEAVLILSIVLPLALFPFAMVLISVVRENQFYAWILVGAGLVPLISTALASIGAPAASRQRAASDSPARV